MNASIASLGMMTTLAVCSLARAQERPVPPEEERGRHAPKARSGFQLALRTGASIPFGKYADAPNANMSDFVAPQVPLLVDVGGKIGHHVFLGAYFGIGFGAAAGRTADVCEATDASCGAFSLRFGPEVLVFFMPDRKVNPWVGYGIGRESIALGSSAGAVDTATAFGGWEFAHVMGGVDFRLNRVFGIGPFVDYALGSYSNFAIENDPGPDTDGDVEETALHHWLTIGARFVFFP